MEGVKAFVLGYTGEVGKALVKELAGDEFFKSVVLIGRRTVDLPEQCDARFVQKNIDFDKVEEHADAFKDCTVGFCCLGTTKGKAGAKNFVKVDREYVVNCATVAKQQGCQHFHLVSSKGADKNSWILYTKTKGEVEERLATIELPKLSIYRPAALLCKRVESRPGERIILTLLKPLTALSPTAISVPVEKVARAMINKTKNPPQESCVEILDNAKIHELGK